MRDIIDFCISLCHMWENICWGLHFAMSTDICQSVLKIYDSLVSKWTILEICIHSPPYWFPYKQLEFDCSYKIIISYTSELQYSQTKTVCVQWFLTKQCGHSRKIMIYWQVVSNYISAIVLNGNILWSRYWAIHDELFLQLGNFLHLTQ
jgi:hypothetical protein